MELLSFSWRRLYSPRLQLPHQHHSFPNACTHSSAYPRTHAGPNARTHAGPNARAHGFCELHCFV